MALKGFGNFGHLSLENPVSISELVGNAIEAQDDSLWDKSKMTNNSGQGDILSREEITKLVTTTIVSRRAMLLEYFSMEVDENGLLYKLPLLLKDYIPDLSAKLPLFLLRLGSEVSIFNERRISSLKNKLLLY